MHHQVERKFFRSLLCLGDLQERLIFWRVKVVKAFDCTPATPFGISTRKREVAVGASADGTPIVQKVTLDDGLDARIPMGSKACFKVGFNLTLMMRPAFVADDSALQAKLLREGDKLALVGY